MAEDYTIGIRITARNDTSSAFAGTRALIRDLESGLLAFGNSPAVRSLEGDLSRASAAAGALGKGGAALGGLALGGTVALGAGIADIGAKSIQAAADFETLTTNIRTNTTLSAEDVNILKDTILRLSVETGAPLDQLAKGFMHIVALSGDAKAAPLILKEATESAVATGGNVENYANILAQAMHEYALDTSGAATEQQRLADIQANAAKTMGLFHLAAADSNVTVEQFADHTSRAVGVAANLNIPLEQVLAVAVSLSKHGFPDMATAQTQVVDMMNKIANPTQAARTEIEALSKATGVDLVSDFSAAGLAQKGLVGVIDDVKAAFERQGLSEAEATGEAEKLINAQRGGLGLAVEVGTGYSDLHKEIDAYADSVRVATVNHEAFAEKLATLQSKQARATAEMHAAEIEIGDHLLPIWSALLEKVADPSSWTTFDRNVQDATHFGDAFAREWKANVDGTGQVFSEFGASVHNIVQTFEKDWSNAVSAVESDWAGLVSAAQAAASAIASAIGGAFSSLGSALHGAVGGPANMAPSYQNKPYIDAAGQPTESPSNGGIANTPNPDYTPPSFDMGGVVPGPLGAPMLAVVHGGETVVPAAGGGSASNITVNVSLNNSAIGVYDFEDMVVQAVTAAQRRGRL